MSRKALLGSSGRSRDRVQRDSKGKEVLRIIPFFFVKGKRGMAAQTFCFNRPNLWDALSNPGLCINRANPLARRLGTSPADLSLESGLSALFCLKCNSMRGRLIFTGQTSRHAPQRLDAWGRSFASFRPISDGVTIAPIGPG
jgi:hypothetical protein